MNAIRRVLRNKVFRLMLIVFGVWVVVCGVLALMLLRAGDVSTAEPSDAIVVLGAGLRRDGRPGDALYRRTVWAAQAYADGLAPAIICTGGQSEGRPRAESEACRELLMSEGVPSEAIFLERESRSTEENAINAKQMMEEQGWESVIVVTDAFHMLRADWIFTSYDVPHTNHPVPRNWVRWTWYSAGAAREIVAMHWFLVKEALNLPYTDFILRF